MCVAEKPAPRQPSCCGQATPEPVRFVFAAFIPRALDMKKVRPLWVSRTQEPPRLSRAIVARSDVDTFSPREIEPDPCGFVDAARHGTGSSNTPQPHNTQYIGHLFGEVGQYILPLSAPGGLGPPRPPRTSMSVGRSLQSCRVSAEEINLGSTHLQDVATSPDEDGGGELAWGDLQRPCRLRGKESVAHRGMMNATVHFPLLLLSRVFEGSTWGFRSVTGPPHRLQPTSSPAQPDIELIQSPVNKKGREGKERRGTSAPSLPPVVPCPATG